MKRLLQALLNSIFPGDIVRNNDVRRSHRYKTHLVDSLGRGPTGELFVSYFEDHSRKVCITFPAKSLTKMKWQTFKNEWKICLGKPVPFQVEKPSTLEQLCADKNIKHLYADLINSSTTESFKANMELINKMLSNSK